MLKADGFSSHEGGNLFIPTTPMAPQHTCAQAQAPLCTPFSRPCKCLPPGWLLILLDHSWDHLSRLSSCYFYSTSHCPPSTAWLNDCCSKLSIFRGRCTDCKWLGHIKRQAHASLPDTWALRVLGTQYPPLGQSLPGWILPVDIERDWPSGQLL